MDRAEISRIAHTDHPIAAPVAAARWSAGCSSDWTRRHPVASSTSAAARAPGCSSCSRADPT